jgi:hypothetical protein
MPNPTPKPDAQGHTPRVKQVAHQGYAALQIGNRTAIVSNFTADEILGIVRAVNNHDRLKSALEAAQCDCTPHERDSGHKTGCWFPEAEAALAALGGES